MIATPIISIRVKLGGSVTANQCAITGQFVTMTNLGIVSAVQPIHTQTNNTSAVVIVPNTLTGSISTLKNLQVYNADTVNATVTIEQYNNQDSSTRTVCTKTLIPSETLIIDADGNISTLLEGATISHSTLANLTWSGSGHTGNASTVASFASNGTAQYLTTNGSGSVVLTSNASLTNANLTTPILGTPQNGNLTNCNGTAQNLTAGNVSYLNLSTNTTNISGTLPIDRGGVDLTAWDAYTPSLTGITLGNGTLTASYKKIGKTVFYRVTLAFGSTTSITGNVSISTPTTVAGSTIQPLSEVFLLDSNVGYYNGRQFGNGNVLYMSNPITAITATNPFTWTTNDVIIIKGFYESST